MKIYRTYSSKETKKLGAFFARRILKTKKHRKKAMVLGLVGELGAGKTTFAQGFFRGLGLKTRVMSPTFIIMRRTSLKDKFYKNIFHVDAYRLKNSRDLSGLGFKKILNDPQNVVLVEWAEKVRKILPKKTTYWINFGYGKRINERFINLTF